MYVSAHLSFPSTVLFSVSLLTGLCTLGFADPPTIRLFVVGRCDACQAPELFLAWGSRERGRFLTKLRCCENGYPKTNTEDNRQESNRGNIPYNSTHRQYGHIIQHFRYFYEVISRHVDRTTYYILNISEAVLSSCNGCFSPVGL